MDLNELIMLGACSMIHLNKNRNPDGTPNSGLQLPSAWEVQDVVKAAKMVWREVIRTSHD